MRVNHRIFVALLVATLTLSIQGFATAQESSEPDNYSTWVRKQVQDAVTAVGAVARNGNGVANQTESPSTDQASTSLVDMSSASDFVSMALNMTGLNATNDEDSMPTSGSVTATLYSLIAAARGLPVTDPVFYKTGTKWRRLAMTIGTEESTLEEHFTDKPSANVGAKFLILNSRDVYSTNGQKQLRSIEASGAEFQRIELDATNELQCLIFKTFHSEGRCDRNDQAFQSFLLNELSQNWPSTREELEAQPQAMENVSRVVARLAAGRKVAMDAIAEDIEKIQRGRQFSIAYYTKQREDDGTDEHRAELIFDYGLSERLNWTANASYDYRDHKTSEATSGGRFATELQAKLNNPGSQAWSARPVTLSASGEASRASGTDWLVRAQVKLMVPIMAGVDVPIAYTYANRDDQGITAGSQLKLSLAVDPVRLRQWFTRSAEARDGN